MIDKRITLLLIFTFTINILFAQTTEEDIAFETDTLDIQDDIIEKEDSLLMDLLDLQIVNDSSEIEYDIPLSAIEHGVIMDEDSVIFDLPEGMDVNIDSLLNSWYAQNLLKSLNCDSHDVSH